MIPPHAVTNQDTLDNQTQTIGRLGLRRHLPAEAAGHRRVMAGDTGLARVVFALRDPVIRYAAREVR